MSLIRKIASALLAGTAPVAVTPVLAQIAQTTAPVDAVLPQTSAAPSNPAPAAAPVGDAPEAADTTAPVSQEIVVTGSSIRGVAPTGSALTTVSRADIVSTGATTSTELLRSVPQIGSFNATGGNTGANQAGFLDQPAIHGIGVGNGGGGLTLLLLDGLRLPGAGINQTSPDAGVIPASAVERVEVIADGASSIYGSDAVAGVINFILRKNYDGAETVARAGFGNGYRTYNFSQLAGKSWGTGSLLFDYEYSKNSNVNGTERNYYGEVQPGHGVDGRSTLCSPANVTVGGTVYGLSASGATAGVANRCDSNKANDLYPAQYRNQFLASFHQELGNTFEIHARTLYSWRHLDSLQAISGSNVTAGGEAVTVNSGPYYDYVLGLGVPAGTQTVTYNPAGDFGATIRNRIRTETWSSNVGAEAKLGGDWRANIDLNYGREVDDIYEGGINQALAITDAANGTLNPYGVGPATDPSVLAAIKDYQTWYHGLQTTKEATGKLSGTLFDLPAGGVKLAVGGDIRRELFAGSVRVGPVSDPTVTTTKSVGKRNVKSIYGELYIPVFGSANAIPAIEKLDISASVRYDHYNDVGNTVNPKVGVNWQPVDGLLLHGSYGTSFHAPSLADAPTAIDTRVQRFADFTGSSMPGAYSIILAGGNTLKPETAKTYSLGADFTPTFARGVKLSATYFRVQYDNVITFPGFQVVTEPDNPIYDAYRIYNPSVDQVLAATAGMRHDGLSYPDTTQLPTAIYDLRRQNFASQFIDGIDFNGSYSFERFGGRFDVGAAGTWLLDFDQTINGDTATVSRLNTSYAPKLKVRGNLSWSSPNIDASVFLNYTSHYRNTTDDSRVKSFTTVDLHAGYTLPIGGAMHDTQLTVDVTNLFDQDPPYYYDGNTLLGYDSANASALGRVVTIGIRKKF